MTFSFKRPETSPEALKLRVVRLGDVDTLGVENDWLNREDFEREYVAFSGSFGTHGPHVFAAAPALLSVVLELIESFELAAAVLQTGGRKLDARTKAMLDRARAAIALANGAPT